MMNTEVFESYLLQKTMDINNPQKAPTASVAASHTSAVLDRPNQSCQHSSPIPKQQQKANKAQENPPPPPNAAHPKTPMIEYSMK
jgi:hypothetical protein